MGYEATFVAAGKARVPNPDGDIVSAASAIHGDVAAVAHEGVRVFLVEYVRMPGIREAARTQQMLVNFDRLERREE